MIKFKGTIQSGSQHFTARMTQYVGVFEEATGEKLFPGTLNVKIAENVKIKPHFTVEGRKIGEPEQDLLFEICRLNGKWGYRIRPYHVQNGSGGHGDNVIEIACRDQIKSDGLKDGDIVEIEFFRDLLDVRTPNRRGTPENPQPMSQPVSPQPSWSQSAAGRRAAFAPLSWVVVGGLALVAVFGMVLLSWWS